MLGALSLVLVLLEDGDGGIFVVSERFDVYFGRFTGYWGVFGRWCWGRLWVMGSF